MTIKYQGRVATAPVWDIGPWNIRDNYWDLSREDGVGRKREGPCHGRPHPVDGQQGEVVRVRREVVVVGRTERTPGLDGSRHVHDDAGVPPVVVARHQPDERRHDPAGQGHDDRRPPVLGPRREPDEEG